MGSVSPKSPQGKLPEASPGFVFIYGLVDPRKREKIRYVGKATDPQRRLRYHIDDSRKRSRQKFPVCHWVNKLLRAGVKPEMVILEQAPVDKWEETEKYWIALYRFRYDDLLNISDGGGYAVPFELYSRGTNRPNAKLTDDLVIEMRILRSQGATIAALAEQFDIDRSIVVQICRGDMWKHIGGPRTCKPYKRTQLNEELVVEIRTLRSQGMTNTSIAKKFGIDSGTVSRVCRGEVWKDTGGPVTIDAYFSVSPCKGEDHPKTRLTRDQVEQMRSMYATGGYTQAQLAQLFGIGHSTVGYIVNYLTWK